MAVSGDYGGHVRGAMQNMHSGDFTNFLFNPTVLNAAVAAKYSKIGTQGGTHDELQYDGTGNTSIPITLEWSLAAYTEEQRTGNIITQADARNIVEQFQKEHDFFLAFMYPIGEANDELQRAPPTTLLAWPRHIGMEFVVLSCRYGYQDFSSEGYVTNYSVQMQLDEFATGRMTSAEAGRVGFKRARAMV